MKTFITPDLSESEMPIQVVHDTARIEVVQEEDRLWFEFIALCRSNELIEAINPLGHSSRRADARGGTYVSCDECAKAAGR
jgi:hypothetical protein